MGALEARIKAFPSVSGQPHLQVKWSLGKGNWATVPWLAIMDDRITSTTQSGVYCVFLISHDLSSIYLTLNQGTTAFAAEGSHVMAEKLRARAAELRTEAADLQETDFSRRRYLTRCRWLAWEKLRAWDGCVYQIWSARPPWR